MIEQVLTPAERAARGSAKAEQEALRRAEFLLAECLVSSDPGRLAVQASALIALAAELRVRRGR